MNKPVILCVDDEKIVLISLKEQLKRSLGNDYRIETSESGEDALEIFNELLEDKHEIPVVIADYIMPDMKGDYVLKLMNAISPETRKIMLTGQADIEGVINAVNSANLYRFMSKPWHQEDLVLTVTEAAKSYFQDKQIKEQLKQLMESEEEYRSIFENAIEGIFQSSVTGRFISVNSAFAKTMGYDSPEQLIENITDIKSQLYVIPEKRDEFIRLIKENRIVTGFECEQYRKDKTTIWVSINARPVCDDEGNILFIQGFVEDISVRREKEKAEREREIAEAANKKIMESIHYAKMIQRSLLANSDEIKTYLPDSFFIWEPRDIVGGDIFFTEKLEDGFIVAVVDCTGHGVPGAFMTMIASSGLRKIIRDEGCHNPAEILKRLNHFVKKTLHQDTKYAVSDDGLDAGICFIESESKTARRLVFAGAKLSLFCVHNGEVNVIRGDKQSIGYKRSDLNFNYHDYTVSIEKTMSFYMATDGFADQMGINRRRFGSGQFRELLKVISSLPFEKQREMMIEAYEAHKGSRPRQDDVTVAGFGF
jgi:PAS domain S-box-containing protein